LREREAPSIHPLISQPVVELCLRIPTYVLLNGGVSRGLAREAFKDILPKEVYGRVSKGTGSTAQQQFISHNMPLIRERLLDGILVREGILDKRKLESFLVPDQKFLTVLPSQVSDYVVVEGWLSGWTNHLRQQQAA
jgi:asparagine synthase (glutamine-hydrolysing)